MDSSAAGPSLAEASSRFHLPGVSASIAVSDRPTVTFTDGLADRRHKSPVSEDTRFRIGSVSKALTSIALVRLIDDGLVDLDAPVQRYVPEFPVTSASPTTIRHLAAHASGLPHYRMKDFVNRRHYRTSTEALEKFADRPLLFEPGEGFAYSSFGWNLLGVALEAASGLPFDQLMNDIVFSPLGMENTAIETLTLSHQAKPYMRLGPAILPAPRIDPSDAIPSAGFIATSADLVCAGRAVATCDGISASGVDLLWTETVTTHGEPTGYGVGWHRIEVAGSAGWGHGGSHVGATALLAVLPERRITVAVVTNTNAPSGALTTIAERMIESHAP